MDGFILTDIGAATIEAAYQAGEVVTLTTVAVGDGGGSAPEVDPTLTALVGQFGTVPLNAGTVDVGMLGGQAIVKAKTFPGKVVREFGLLSDDGVLIGYGAYPDTYLPEQDDSIVKELIVDFAMQLVNAESVILEIDPNIAVLTQDQADARYLNEEANLSDVRDAAEACRNIGALPLTGGDLTGPVTTSAEIRSTIQDNFRMVNGDRGTFWRLDGNSLYLMQTAPGDPFGSYDDTRPLRVDLATGLVYINDARPYSPNNPQPGPDLSGYIVGDACHQAGFVSQNVNDPYMMYDGGTVVSLAPREWVNQNLVTATGLGAEYGATRFSGEAHADLGCIISGIGDFGADDGYGYQRPMQYQINGAWYTSAVLGRSSQNEAKFITNPKKSPAVITHLTNCRPYTPSEKIHQDTFYLISEEGFDFYEARNKFSPGHIVGYDPATGVIRLIAEDARFIWPFGMSVVVIDELPDNVDMSGKWAYNGTDVVPYAPPADEILHRNRKALMRLIRTAAEMAFPLQSAVKLNVATDAQLAALAAWEQYAVDLLGVDLTVAKPDWPDVPA